jgi:hypothetical protein
VSVQVRVVRGRKDEVVVGPDGADVVVTVPVADALADPAVAFMQGRLKAAGHTGVLFDALRSGEIAALLRDAAAG